MLSQPLLSFAEDDIVAALGTSGFKRSFLIYHCKECFQILVVCTRELSERQVDAVRNGRCPRCVNSLSETLSCRSVNAPFETKFWNHPQIDLSLQIETRYSPRFITAYSLFGLSSQIGFIDALIGGLRSDTIALIRGSRIPRLVAERYCVRAQLPEDMGGFGGRSLFIDAGNSFDVYLFTSIAREYVLDFDHALNRIIISRAFTPYELLQLVSNDGDEVFEVYHPQLLVINDIFHLFTQDVEEDEARRIMRKIGYAIRRTSQLRHVPIVITSMSKAQYLEYLFRDYCSVEVEFTEEENHIKAKLLKHPSRLPTEIVQELSQRTYNQQLLVPLRVNVSG